MKLLVATDLSQGPRSLIDAVNERPWPAGSEVCVLHVVDVTPFPLGAELMEAARKGAESAVKSIGERLGPSGLKARTEVLLGAPPRVIPEYAGTWGADLVVVGSHSGSGLARLLLGSVARNVVRTAPCSVEIVRAHDPSHTRTAFKILLAMDGSDRSILAARSVAERPWPTGTCVKIISAVPPFVPVADIETGYFYGEQAILVAEAVEKAERSRAVEAIAKAREILRKSPIAQIEGSEPLTGDPKAVILDHAAEWGADMIVVGSHGWRGFDRLIMGSVSEAVALHAHCSVEVIR
jgi:nucleotide-binding universal stress UspA family protein